MTNVKPKISYGHAFLEDCNEANAPNWDKTESNMTMAPIVVVNDDIFDLQGTVTGATPYGYWKNHTVLGLSTTVYKKCRIRYKVSGAGCHARVRAHFNGGDTQDLLVSGSSSTWKTIAYDLTGAYTLDYLSLWVMDASGHVYFDFALVYKDDFTFPNTAHGLSFVPAARYVRPVPPGMAGAETENLGSDLAVVTIHSDLDLGTWTRTGDVLPGEVFLDIVHNSKTEDFQWLDLGDLLCKFKVTLDKPEFEAQTSESTAQKLLLLMLYEYRRGPANDETYAERYGLI